MPIIGGYNNIINLVTHSIKQHYDTNKCLDLFLPFSQKIPFFFVHFFLNILFEKGTGFSNIVILRYLFFIIHLTRSIFDTIFFFKYWSLMYVLKLFWTCVQNACQLFMTIIEKTRKSNFFVRMNFPSQSFVRLIF